MKRLQALATSTPAQSFILAAVVFAVALMGHATLLLAAALAGIMVAFAALLLIARRVEAVHLLAQPAEDERSVSVHVKAAAVMGNLLVVIIVVAFFVELARGNFYPTPWVALGAVSGASYLAALFWFTRRG